MKIETISYNAMEYSGNSLEYYSTIGYFTTTTITFTTTIMFTTTIIIISSTITISISSNFANSSFSFVVNNFNYYFTIKSLLSFNH